MNNDPKLGGSAEKMSGLEGIKQVMFVCSGNTCRSPMAEYLFRDMCKKQGLSINVISRGLTSIQFAGFKISSSPYTSPHRFIMPEAEFAVQEYDPEISGISQHIPTTISYKDIDESDLVLTMEAYIRDRILASFSKSPDLEHKVYTLKELTGFFSDPDIGDPVAPTENFYNKAYKEVSIEQFTDRRVIDGKKFEYFDYTSFKYSVHKKIYSLCRDEIVKCLKILIGKLPSHEEIISKRVKLPYDYTKSWRLH